MDIIRRYLPKVTDFTDKEKACRQLIQEFMANYSSIIYESESQFICKYFMSAILAFCADIDFKDSRLLEQFLRFFVANQSGIWDIWSVYQFEPKQWTTIENCLGIDLTNLREKNGFIAMKYIIEFAHNLDIEFSDSNDLMARIRFIDYPRFDSIESKSELWRNLHLPIIDCTLLPENPYFLRLLLQFGATVPTLDHQIPHFVQRIRHSVTNASLERLMKKLFWIQLIRIEISHSIRFYRELSVIGNQIIEILKTKFDFQKKTSVLDLIPQIPELKQLARHSIRQNFRLKHKLPQNIEKLEIQSILKEYLNLIYI